jgi:hypothetical protein
MFLKKNEQSEVPITDAQIINFIAMGICNGEHVLAMSEEQLYTFLPLFAVQIRNFSLDMYSHIESRRDKKTKYKLGMFSLSWSIIPPILFSIFLWIKLT